MRPPVHPALQMEPAAEAACASLLSEPPWPVAALPAPCRAGAGLCWPVWAHACPGRHVPYLWCSEHGPLRVGYLKAVLEEVSEHCSC